MRCYGTTQACSQLAAYGGKIVSETYDAIKTDLLNYDQVSALSLKTINAQIAGLVRMGLITDTIDFEADSENYFRAQIDVPTVDINLGEGKISPTTVILSFNILSGSAQGKVITKTISCPDLSGYKAQYVVDLKLANPLADGNILISQKAQAALSDFDQNAYSMTSVILALDSINYGTCSFYDPKGEEDGELEFLLPILIDAVAGNGNPFLISINPMYLAGSGQMSGLDGFRPTTLNYRTQFYNNVIATSDLNSLNLMIMNQEHTAPNIDPRATYPTNLGPTSSSPDGYLYISYAQFYNNYFLPYVVNVLANAFGNKASFQYASGIYTYDWHYSNAGDDPNGSDKGPIVGQDAFIDVHQTVQKWIHCELSEPKSGPDGTVVIQASGYLREDADYYEYWVLWMHTGQSQVKEDFSFTITLSAGDGGRITVDVDGSHQPGTINGNTSPHTWTNILVSFTDWISGIVGWPTVESSVDRMKDEAETMITSAITGFQNNVPELFQSLSDVVILPTGEAYIFNSIQINNEGDAVFAFKINS